MSYADVNGISLCYEEHGSGSSLILLHGGLGMGEMYGWYPESVAGMDQMGSARRAVTSSLDAPSLQPPAPPRRLGR
jgi:pimeloyl-ACP methyl ester carboxylesterase